MPQEQPVPNFFDWNCQALQSRYSNLSIATPANLYETSTPHFEIEVSAFQSWLMKHQSQSHLVVSTGISPALKPLYSHLCLSSHGGLLIVEPSLLRVQRAFQRYDFRELILSPYVYWIVDEEWQEPLKEWMAQRGVFQLQADEFYFVGSSDEINSLRQTFQRGMQEAGQKFSKALQAFVRKQSLQNPKPVVWAHTEERAGIYRRLIKAMMDGFRQNGCEVHLSHFGEEWGAEEKLRSELVNASPDACFLINGPSPHALAHLGIPESWLAQNEVRRVTWYLDQPRFLPSWQKEVSCRLDDVALMDGTHRGEFNSAQFNTLFRLPGFASVSRMGRAMDEFRFPIVYVGSLMDVQEFTGTLSSSAQSLLEQFVQRRIEEPALSIKQIEEMVQPNQVPFAQLVQCAQQFNHTRMNGRFADDRRALDYFVYVAAIYSKRVKVAQALLPLGLHIYGPNDWVSVVGERYKDRVLGIADAERLPDVFASAKININLQSLQCPTAINFRDYDILRSGGFLLSEWVIEFDREILQDGTHCSLFHNPDELAEKVNYYLHHQDERRMIAEQGSETAAEHHTAKQRAKLVIEHLFPGWESEQ